MSSAPIDGPAVRRARWAVSTIFFLNGATIGSWAAHIPLSEERLGISHATLGLMLLAMAAGALVAMPIAGGMAGRRGSAFATRLTTILFPFTLLLPILAPGPLTFAAGLFLFGALNGAMDVAMNAHAVAVEKAIARPVMSSFHGMFSLGGLAGAALAALLITVIPEGAHAALVTLVALGLAGLSLPHLLPGRVDAEANASHFALPTAATATLGLLAFLALGSEGAVLDWSALHLRSELDLGAGLAATGYAAFSAAMALGRFGGDWLRSRFDAAAVVRGSGLLAAAGLALSLLSSSPVLAVIGFAVVGLGMANLVPLIFTAAGRLPDQTAGGGIAAIATMGYAGFLTGPPLIGFTAQVTNLGLALSGVVLSCVVVALMAGTVRGGAAQERL